MSWSDWSYGEVSGSYTELCVWVTPPKSNSSPRKIDGWKTILSYWEVGKVTFQGRTVKLRGGMSGWVRFFWQPMIWKNFFGCSSRQTAKALSVWGWHHAICSCTSSWWFQFQIFLFSTLLGEDSHSDSYFSIGMKPPLRQVSNLSIIIDSCFYILEPLRSFNYLIYLNSQVQALHKNHDGSHNFSSDQSSNSSCCFSSAPNALAKPWGVQITYYD